jgi:hypothetical protein
MTETGQSQPAPPYNVVAAFPTEGAATAAVERLTGAGVPPSAISRHRPGQPSPDETAELRAEMQDELADGWVGPAGLVMTPSQAKGAFVGTAIAAAVGGLLGLAAGLLWAYAVDSTFSRPARIILAVCLGIIGGATVGFVVGGIAKPLQEGDRDPERPAEDRRMPGERDYLVAVHSQERDLVERASTILRDAGAEQVHLVDGAQTPLPPQAAHPRPADPQGWWWRRAGHG